MDHELLEVCVTRVEQQTEDVRSLELTSVSGSLPAFRAGAHVDVHTGAGPRQYSLCNSPSDVGRYVIGVKRESEGRGGSRWMHDHIGQGDRLKISVPRQNFQLAGGALHHCLLAGGIGITPILSMAEQLWHDDESFELCCFVRSPAHVPFLDRLRKAPWIGQVRFHFDDSPGQRVDMARLLKSQPAGTHLYLCGPAGFMVAARIAAAGLNPEQIHQEYFAAPPIATASTPFVVELVRSQRTVYVKADQTLLQALRADGVEVITSCEVGACGTCVTRYLSGQPEHGDSCLSVRERESMVALCCARSSGERLVLDL
ncbi:MAG: ophA1 2 [Ramlibacter sp.]|nr:ophA1 2 [Ramlibacter sp.]